MTKIPHILALALLFFAPLHVSADENGVSCEDLEAPITSVADFDANGIVNGKDMAMIAHRIGKKHSRHARKKHNRHDDDENHSRHSRKKHDRHDDDEEHSRHSRKKHDRHDGEEKHSKHSRKKHARHGKKHSEYSKLFDRNADGELDSIDMFLATRDMGKVSSQNDQELVVAYIGTLDGTYTCVEEVEENDDIVIEPTPDIIIIDNGGGGFGGTTTTTTIFVP